MLLFSCASDVGNLQVAANLHQTFTSKFPIMEENIAELVMKMFAKCGGLSFAERVSYKRINNIHKYKK